VWSPEKLLLLCHIHGVLKNSSLYAIFIDLWLNAIYPMKRTWEGLQAGVTPFPEVIHAQELV
jgi:hypothetical protein